MNTEALLKVAEILETKAPIAVYDADDDYTGVAFDMGSWSDTEVTVGKDDPNGPPIAHICGTSACAAGHAALDPWFQERGLELVMLEIMPDEEIKPIVIKSDEHLKQAAIDAVMRSNTYSFTMRYRARNGMAAVEEFFELDPSAAHHCFGAASRRTTARTVARAIRQTAEQALHNENEEGIVIEIPR